jgi:hypothetical protein
MALSSEVSSQNVRTAAKWAPGQQHTAWAREMGKQPHPGPFPDALAVVMGIQGLGVPNWASGTRNAKSWGGFAPRAHTLPQAHTGINAELSSPTIRIPSQAFLGSQVQAKKTVRSQAVKSEPQCRAVWEEGLGMWCGECV